MTPPRARCATGWPSSSSRRPTRSRRSTSTSSTASYAGQWDQDRQRRGFESDAVHATRSIGIGTAPTGGSRLYLGSWPSYTLTPGRALYIPPGAALGAQRSRHLVLGDPHVLHCCLRAREPDRGLQCAPSAPAPQPTRTRAFHHRRHSQDLRHGTPRHGTTSSVRRGPHEAAERPMSDWFQGLRDARASDDEWNQPKLGAQTPRPPVQRRQHPRLHGLFERVTGVLTAQQDRRYDQMRFP